MDIETNHLGKIFKGSHQFMLKHLEKNDFEWVTIHHIDEFFAKKGFLEGLKEKGREELWNKIRDAQN